MGAHVLMTSWISAVFASKGSREIYAIQVFELYRSPKFQLLCYSNEIFQYLCYLTHVVGIHWFSKFGTRQTLGLFWVWKETLRYACKKYIYIIEKQKRLNEILPDYVHKILFWSFLQNPNFDMPQLLTTRVILVQRLSYLKTLKQFLDWFAIMK